MAALPPERQPVQTQDSYAVDGVQIPRVYVSARQGVGLDVLRENIADFARQALVREGTADADWYSQQESENKPDTEQDIA